MKVSPDLTNDQIKAIAADPSMALTTLRYLLASPVNVNKLRKLSTEDILIARFLERLGYDSGSNWRELSRQEVLANRAKRNEAS